MDIRSGTISTSKISDIAFNSDGTFSGSGSTTLAFKFSGISGTQSVILISAHQVKVMVLHKMAVIQQPPPQARTVMNMARLILYR